MKNLRESITEKYDRDEYKHLMVREDVFGSAEFIGNDEFENCSRYQVLHTNNVKLNIVMSEYKFDNPRKVMHAIMAYSMTADSWLLTDTLNKLNVKVFIDDFSFPYTPLNEIEDGVDAAVEQTIHIFSLSGVKETEERITEELINWKIFAHTSVSIQFGDFEKYSTKFIFKAVY